MKLKYSTSLVTLIYIHILFIHILFIHLSPMSVGASTNEKHEDEASKLHQISQENKKILDEQVKAHLLKVLGLKEVPKKPQNKAYVPHAMLEEYRRIRESVRDVIPDDRDFYGKINLDDLEQGHEDFWGAVYNKYGGYDIEVDMDLNNEESRRLHYKGDATPIACLVPQGEPEDVPPRLEHALPPHASSIKNQKHYISVHLRFKLSQEVFTEPMKANDIKRADLYLSRERIYQCEFDDCDRKPVPLSTSGDKKQPSNLKDDTNSKSSEADMSDSNTNLTNKRLRNRPRYQRVYILHIYGYDDHNEPIARIHDTKRIDTTESTPLTFEISRIIKRWLIDPSKNYGIIVRVTNDDDEFEKMMMQQQQEQQLQIQKRSVTGTITNNNNPTNASQNNIFDQKTVEVAEHIRLKREFRSYGESDESWLKKQPSILIYSNSQDATRNHVKRDYSADENEDMQADNPNAGDYITNTTNTSTNNNPMPPPKSYDNQSQQQPSRRNLVPSPSFTSTSTDRTISTNGKIRSPSNHLISIRDSRHVSSQNQHNRNNPSSGARSTPNGTNNHKFKKGKSGFRAAEKCSVRTLSINFDDVGWSNWIIAPTAYFANYCAGDCSFPVNSQQNTTNHAIIQSIFFSVGRVVPRSCCAPVRLGNMAILYQLDGSVQMKHYDDMIVEACGCL